ncbi:MAG: MAPEG family protein [Burkholderiaceae bacterium]|jgi:hypothetical protein|nr:MAPEG family protein [Burkholderiaceae bacterium]
MHKTDILYPIFVLAAWTVIVLVQVPIVRFYAAFGHEVVESDFKLGESAAVPAYVSLPNRNYMNLLELPVLFYVVCLLFYMTNGVSLIVVQIAWVYVALRLAHSAVHLSYNNSVHRFLVFALSNLVLIALWIFAALHIFFNKTTL